MAKNPRKRLPSNDPVTAREALGTALGKAAPAAGQAYEIVKGKVEGPARAALSKMSRRARIGVAAIGIALSAMVGSAAVNGVVRPTIAAGASATLGPSYRIQCQNANGNWGVCTPKRR